MAACRDFAHRMNQVRDAEKHPEQAVHAGQLFAMGLIDEASHVLMAALSRAVRSPGDDRRARLVSPPQVGADKLDKMLLAFVEQFPGSERHARPGDAGAVARRLRPTARRIAPPRSKSCCCSGRPIATTAFKPFEELFEDQPLAEKTVYRQVTAQMPEYFATRPLIPLPGAKPVSLLRSAARSGRWLARFAQRAARAHPPALEAAARRRLERFLLMAGEILREEELAIWAQFNPPPGCRAPPPQQPPGRTPPPRAGCSSGPPSAATAEVPTFGDPAHEYEKFSPDIAWMPGAVLIAKSTYVWLAQLSREYGRAHRPPRRDPRRRARHARPPRHQFALAHRRLGAQPRLARPSSSSAAIRMPSPRAYSLFDYRIADDLGGEPAYINLRDRCLSPRHPPGQRHGAQPHGHRFALGHRASRVVHLALGSPYPAYSFNGPDLSTTAASRSRSRTTTTSSPTPPSSSGAATKPAAKRATSTTATTAPAFPGTTPRSSTTSIPPCASRSSRPSCMSRACSRSFALTPP